MLCLLYPPGMWLIVRYLNAVSERQTNILEYRCELADDTRVGKL